MCWHHLPSLLLLLPNWLSIRLRTLDPPLVGIVTTTILYRICRCIQIILSCEILAKQVHMWAFAYLLAFLWSWVYWLNPKEWAECHVINFSSFPYKRGSGVRGACWSWGWKSQGIKENCKIKTKAFLKGTKSLKNNRRKKNQIQTVWYQ